MLKPSKALLIVGGVLLLAGCSTAKSDDASERSTLSASGEPLRAGLYRVVQTGDVDHQDERCIGAADVAAGRFAVPGTIEDGWTVDTNRMSGGTIEVAARHPSGSRLNIEGTFQKESFDVEGTMEMELNGETHAIRTRQVGAFVSPACPAEAA